MISRNVIGIVVIPAILIISTLTGCATASNPDAMIVESVAITHVSNSGVSVVVSGGKETSALWTSQISDEAFAQALRESIIKSGLFKTITNNGGRYKLSAFIGEVDQPMVGFSMTVKMEVSYTLLDTQSGKTVWSKNIASEYTVKLSDAFVGATRLRLANEGAAKANIQQALTELSTIQF